VWLSEKFDGIVEQLGTDRLLNASGNAVVGAKIVRLLQNGRIGCTYLSW
jgi:hypothetical protein